MMAHPTISPNVSKKAVSEESEESVLRSELPTFPEFIALSSIDRDAYEAFIKPFKPYSDFEYTSLYAWARDGEALVSYLNGNIVLSVQDYMSNQRILSFLGNTLVNDVATTLLDYVAIRPEYLDELCLIPEETAKQITLPNLSVEEDEDNYDYILSTKHFVDLLGPEAAHTRRKVSQFIRRCGQDATVRSIELRDLPSQRAVRKLAHEWASMGTQGSITASQEISAIEHLLRDINILDKRGTIHCLGLYSGRQLIGFCIYELHTEYATVHFKKADLRFDGAADYMMVQVMRHIYLEHNIMKVNHEQDLGIEGLRAAKRRYNPTSYLKKYTVRRKLNNN